MAEITPPALPRPTVLLVDDDALIRDTVSVMIEHLGFSAVTAESGEEALAALEQGLEPATVILDMDMPGMGGARALPHILVQRPGARVIVCTGRVDAAVRALVQAHANVGLMPKPFDLHDLRTQLADGLTA